MRHRGDGAAWARCAIMIYSLPPYIEIAEAGKSGGDLEAKSMHHRDCNLRHALSASSHLDIDTDFHKARTQAYRLYMPFGLRIRRKSVAMAMFLLEGSARLAYPQSGLEQHPCLLRLCLFLITTSFTETILSPRDAAQTLHSHPPGSRVEADGRGWQVVAGHTVNSFRM